MTETDMTQKIEAMLFVSGNEGISLEEMAELLHRSKFEIKNCLDELLEKYENSTSALTIIETAGRYKMVTKPHLYSTVKHYAQSDVGHKLSQAALEILAIIAYRQPVTRLDIEEIRGVQSSGPIQRLILHQLVKEDGRLDLPGRPILYATTDYFLDYFGLSSLDDLPQIDTEDSDKEKDLFFESFQISFNDL